MSIASNLTNSKYKTSNEKLPSFSEYNESFTYFSAFRPIWDFQKNSMLLKTCGSRLKKLIVPFLISNPITSSSNNGILKSKRGQNSLNITIFFKDLCKILSFKWYLFFWKIRKIKKHLAYIILKLSRQMYGRNQCVWRSKQYDYLQQLFFLSKLIK